VSFDLGKSWFWKCSKVAYSPVTCAVFHIYQKCAHVLAKYTPNAVL